MVENVWTVEGFVGFAIKIYLFINASREKATYICVYLLCSTLPEP
jgi:hypothetical protein